MARAHGPWRPSRRHDLIHAAETAFGIEAGYNTLRMQMGDVEKAGGDIEEAVGVVGFRPTTPVEEGMRRFLEWYREYCC